MRIGFDARMMNHPGIGTYINSLLDAMLPLATKHEFVLFGNKEKLAAFSSRFENITLVECSERIYSLKDQIMSHSFNRQRLDVLHCPHFNTPFFYNKPMVVTIHDFIYLKFPESTSSIAARAYANMVIRASVTKAKRIIAVSENTKKDILKKFPPAEEKTKVIYEAAAGVFRRIGDENKKEAVRKKYNLLNDVILFVGSLKKHKNIERLLDVYKDLKSKGIKHKLVIVGRFRPREAQVLKEINLTDALYLGEIPSEDLVMLYNIADLLVMPSLYEGFGFPVLEAMACGTPVAASVAASLPELVKDAGILFNPYNVTDMSENIYKVLTDKTLKDSLVAKGLVRVEEFSWTKTAQDTLKVYEEAYAGGR